MKKSYSKKKEISTFQENYCYSQYLGFISYFIKDVRSLFLQNLDLEKLGEGFKEKIEKKKFQEVELIKISSSRFINFNSDNLRFYAIDN